ncbi:MAG: Chromosome partition protein Smc [Phycisphaerae bacterium]|nr:Chromosome partition protein Smc [Phycisphaerae bacterium]
MFLKRVVMLGFKSFADKTQFDFGHGITIIVGPNGCGKSNVVDAIKWVLGEQSAKSLRGTRMNDVIFAGARSRKSANAAEVELTFDNADRTLPIDRDEVAVTRLLYADGASEYRLNAERCRLRDIRDLFLDTGIGVDAYSLIEQGQVDALLRANPAERREIFEEAAGISKYKVRKLETERKLERVRNNLLRLNDVIDEVERRLRSVKLAAGKARNFLECQSRLRELRSSYALAEYHALEQSRSAIAQRCETCSAELLALRDQLDAADGDAAGLDAAQRALDQHIHDTEAEIARLNTEAASLLERTAQAEHRRQELELTRQRRAARDAELVNQLQYLDERIGHEAAQRDALAASAAEHERTLEQLRLVAAESEQRAADSRLAVDQLRAAAFEAARREALLSNEQSNLASLAERLNRQRAALAERRHETSAERQRVQAAAAACAAELSGFDRLLANAQQRARRLDDALAGVQTARRDAEARIAAGREERSAALSRLELLEDLEQRQEGIDEATRCVLAWRDEAPAESAPVVGLVADVFRVDAQYLPQLESVLARFEKHLVVANTYNFLSELQRRGGPPGAIEVFALDRLAGVDRATSYEQAPGFVAAARRFITCEPRFEPLADLLFERVVLVDSRERALALAANAPRGFLFIDPDGTVVGSEGLLAIGRGGGGGGLISRKTEIRALRARLDEVESDLARQSRALAACADQASDLEIQRQAALDEHTQLARRESELRHRRDNLAEWSARVEQQLAATDRELDHLHQSLAEIDETLGRLSEQRADASQAHAAESARIDAQLSAQQDAEEQSRRATERLTAARVDHGRLAEKSAALAASLERLESQRSAAQHEQAQIAAEIDDAARRAEQIAGEIVAARQRRETLVADAARLAEQLLALGAQRDALREAAESHATRTRQLRAAIDTADAQGRAAEIELREALVRIEALVQRIHDELGVELPALYASYQHADQDWDAIRAEIDDLRGRIERLGNVNLDALAELDELSPRYENLVAQRADLNQSIEQLVALIRELDEASQSRFTAAFEQIREHFRELYRKLFGGGRADIVLENPELPLECGIEIIARPPGKEPQSISLLSGGEKTMTAVALLLAVFKSKPSPFAILDEVDAALDESNNERFNMVIQDFLVHSQFIIITHSKTTMQCADALYGVTMEEAGVSKRVSVRFHDRVQTPIVA